MKLLILGAGYSGRQIAVACKPLFDIMAGTTRSVANFEHLRQAGMCPVLYDGKVLSTSLLEEMTDVTHFVQSIAPGETGDSLASGREDLHAHMPALKWAAYLSTVGVYGDHDGAWVNEESELRPVSARSLERVDAERRWQDKAAKADVDLAILRLSGIYGPGRNTFVNFSKGTARSLVKPGQVFNRIRVEDIGRATEFLIRNAMAGTFNITDDEPAPPQDVVAYAAGVMGAEIPPVQDFETADLTPMARSFYGENKRVSNRKIRDLGFEFLYPDYRQSLDELWNSGRWKS